MEGEIPLEVGVDNRKMPLAVLVSRMDSLHTTVQTQDEIIEVQADTQSVRHGYLTPERIKAELTARLLSIITQSPDITRIYKDRPVKLPEKMGTVLNIHIQFQVTGLIDKVNFAVITQERTRS